MPAARPLSLDALRRLIADNDYWNPHSAQHEELQRKVSEGFGRLYPANSTRPDTGPEGRERLDIGPPSVRDLQADYKNLSDQYDYLLQNYFPKPPIYDDDGNLVKDYEAVSPDIEERKGKLLERMRELEDELERLGARPGSKIKMGK
jgi:hypothetical protein